MAWSPSCSSLTSPQSGRLWSGKAEGLPAAGIGCGYPWLCQTGLVLHLAHWPRATLQVSPLSQYQRPQGCRGPPETPDGELWGCAPATVGVSPGLLLPSRKVLGHRAAPLHQLPIFTVTACCSGLGLKIRARRRQALSFETPGLTGQEGCRIQLRAVPPLPSPPSGRFWLT